MHVNKKRLLVLLLLNVLLVVHIVLWYVLGYKKIGTLSLNGIVSLFGFGLLNSAAVFFIVVVFITIFCGRIFCGWGCHFAFFQELALKFLNMLRINPEIIHSRSNIIQYVFLLKTLTAIFEFWLIYGYPTFHINIGDTQVMTIDLPRSPIIIASFVVFDAFLFIYLMGSRAFCRYVCPWAPLLAVFDNFSPWRIRKAGTCRGCMSCTKSCTMGISVHEEINTHNAVVNVNCIRCFACKSACPNGTLHFKRGPNVISLTGGIRWLIPRVSRYNMHYELLLLFPGLIAAFYTQKYLGSFQTFLGAVWGLCFGIILLKTIEHKGVFLSEATLPAKRTFLVVSLTIVSTLFWCWGTYTPGEIRLLMRRNRYVNSGEYNKAIATFTEAINHYPENNEIRSALALAYKNNGDYDKALNEYKILMNNNRDSAVLHNNLGTVYYRKGDYGLAIKEYKKATSLDRNLTAAYGNLGLISLEQGNVEEAISFLKKVFKSEEEVFQYILTYYGSRQGQM